MLRNLLPESIEKFRSHLQPALDSVKNRYPGESIIRQPVHTVYGGAHLFSFDIATKLARLATRSFESYAPDSNVFGRVLDLSPSVAKTVFDRVGKKLTSEAVEDFRIDFEDGYGPRPDDEEDAHAVAAAKELAKGMIAGTLPPFIGIRIKSFSNETLPRSVRTLDLFLSELVSSSNGRMPENFVVTLPKIVEPRQVSVLADIFDELEAKLGLEASSLKIEMMVETTQSIFAADGAIALPRLFEASRGRCRGVHFGAYDYTASNGIAASNQDLLHPACDFARNIMQVGLAGTGAWLSDGATNLMPVEPNRGSELTPKQIVENTLCVHKAWKLHYDHCRNSLASGFYQGWDLHPAQLPTRYAAVYAFFLEGLDDASERLNNFVKKAGRATLVGSVFDDAATGQGLLNYFLRAINCGAVTEQEALERTSLTLVDLRSGSFSEIVKNQQN